MTAFRAIAAAALLVQLALVSVSFPVGELLTSKPLLHNDAGYHTYQIGLARDLAREGVLIGYDPYFNAGYPGGITYNWSAKAPAALGVLLGGRLSDAVAYKLTSFCSALVAPLAVALALRWLGLGAGAAAAGALLGLLLWWASMFRWFHTAGMVSFVGGSFVALPYAAAALRYARGTGGWGTVAILALSGALLLFYHPLFPIPVGVAVLACLLAGPGPASRARAAAALLAVPALSLLPNLIWLEPVRHAQSVFASGVPDTWPFQKIVDASTLWREPLGIWSGNAHGSRAYGAVALLALAGCFAAPGAAQRNASRAWAAAGIVLLLAAAVGAAVPVIAGLQPNRFAPVGYLLLVVPASIGAAAALGSGPTRNASRRRVLGRVLCAGAAPLVLLSAVEVAREVSSAEAGRYGVRPPEVTGLGERGRWMLDWLRLETDPSARVLFETSRARVHDGDRLAGYLARAADRELIGGPYPYHHFAGYWDGFLFGRPIDRIPRDAFAGYLDRYNIGWILAHSDASKRYLAGQPGIVPRGSHEAVAAYRVERPRSFFLRGAGRVAARGPNRLRLEGLSGKEIILKYHFIPGLASDPPAMLDGVMLPDDPNPFIRILNPPPELRIYLP